MLDLHVCVSGDPFAGTYQSGSHSVGFRLSFNESTGLATFARYTADGEMYCDNDPFLVATGPLDQCLPVIPVQWGRDAAHATSSVFVSVEPAPPPAAPVTPLLGLNAEAQTWFGGPLQTACRGGPGVVRNLTVGGVCTREWPQQYAHSTATASCHVWTSCHTALDFRTHALMWTVLWCA